MARGPGPDQESFEVVCYLFEKAGERALLWPQRRTALRSVMRLLPDGLDRDAISAELVGREALSIALEGRGVDEAVLVRLLEADHDWRAIAEAVPMHAALKPEVCWWLLRYYAGSQGKAAAALTAYLRRHPKAPRELPFRVTITVRSRRTSDQRPAVAEIGALLSGETSLQVVLR